MTPRLAALIVAGLLFMAFLVFTAERVWFLSRAVEVTAEVTALDSRDARCGGRKARHNCTKFTATLEFPTETGVQSVRYSAGKARGHGEPVAKARYHVGETMALLYDAKNPKKTVKDTFWSIWGMPIFAGIGHMVILLRGLFTREQG